MIHYLERVETLAQSEGHRFKNGKKRKAFLIQRLSNYQRANSFRTLLTPSIDKADDNLCFKSLHTARATN